MSSWRQIIVSGSHADLRRVKTGPLRASDTTFRVDNNLFQPGENFIPGFDFQEAGNTGTPAGSVGTFGAGDVFFGNAFGSINSIIDVFFDNDDVANAFDGVNTSTDIQDMLVVQDAGSNVNNFQYLYITLPTPMNIDQWSVVYGFTNYVPETDGIWQYATVDPTDYAGSPTFENLWTDWQTSNEIGLNGFTYNAFNFATTNYRYWRFKHKFDSDASTDSGAIMVIRDIQARSNTPVVGGIPTNVIETERHGLQVTGSAIFTSGLQASYLVIPSGVSSLLDALGAASDPNLGPAVFLTGGAGGELFISASKITGPAVANLSLGNEATTMSLGFDPTLSEEEQNDTSLIHVQHDLQVENTASVGYLNIDSGVSFNGIEIQGASTFKDQTNFDGSVIFNSAVSFPNGFSTNVISEIEIDITNNTGPQGNLLDFSIEPYISQTGNTIVEAVINDNKQGGLVLDYTLSNGSAGRTGQFMLTKIGTGGTAIYDFTDTSTKHVGSEATPPFFSASLADDGKLLPMIVQGAGYTLRGFLKRLDT